MVEMQNAQMEWKTALRIALTIGAVYTLFMISRHYLAARTLSGALYIGGMSFVLCSIPVFAVAWVFMRVFGKALFPTSNEVVREE